MPYPALACAACAAIPHWSPAAEVSFALHFRPRAGTVVSANDLRSCRPQKVENADARRASADRLPSRWLHGRHEHSARFASQPPVAGSNQALRACARVVEGGQAFSLSCRPDRVHESGGCSCSFPFVRKQFVLAGEPADGEADHFPKPAASSAVLAYGLSRGQPVG
jgi:hypothetical protein